MLWVPPPRKKLPGHPTLTPAHWGNSAARVGGSVLKCRAQNMKTPNPKRPKQNKETEAYNPLVVKVYAIFSAALRDSERFDLISGLYTRIQWLKQLITERTELFYLEHPHPLLVEILWGWALQGDSGAGQGWAVQGHP